MPSVGVGRPVPSLYGAACGGCGHLGRTSESGVRRRQTCVSALCLPAAKVRYEESDESFYPVGVRNSAGGRLLHRGAQYRNADPHRALFRIRYCQVAGVVGRVCAQRVDDSRQDRTRGPYHRFRRAEGTGQGRVARTALSINPLLSEIFIPAAGDLLLQPSHRISDTDPGQPVRFPSLYRSDHPH